METTTSPGLLALLVALALLDVVLLIASMVGGVALVGWGSRLALKAPTPSVLKGTWLVAFVLLPGAAQLLYSLRRPTPRGFRILAAWTTASFTGATAVTMAFLVLASAAGIETGR